jgi:ABC-2 type transport system ATP-binding protein
MAAIEVSDLTKTYGDVVANDGLTFAVEEGEVFGYLGPNGAGKTTTIRTLLGLQSPTAGTAAVLGADVRDERALIEAKRRVGYLPADPAFDGTVTGQEILDLHAAGKGDERRAELLETFDPPLSRRVREYSSGNRQMLGIVQAFMHDPDLVVLDEPTSGLDPLKQQAFNEFVRAERRAGTTVFMSSHVLGEVRRVCDRVGVIRSGELVTTERVDTLLRRSGKVVRLAVAGGDGERPALAGVHDLSVQQRDDETDRPERGPVTEYAFTYTGDINALLDRIHAWDVLELDVEEAPLEDVFMRFYGDDADPPGREDGGRAQAGGAEPDGAGASPEGGGETASGTEEPSVGTPSGGDAVADTAPTESAAGDDWEWVDLEGDRDA